MHRRTIASVAFAVFAVWLPASPAVAAGTQQRSFVSSGGLDTNACTRSAPCRSFGAAIGATIDGGEVIVLDSAGYGPVSIAQSVSLIAPPGVYAGITAFSGDAIAINSSSAIVVLRGLTLIAQGATNGIDAVAAAALYVDGCDISRFTGVGLLFASSGSLYVDNTSAHDNGEQGFMVLPSSATATGEIDHSRADGNFYGIVIGTNGFFTLRDDVATNNFESGIGATAAVVSVKNCASSKNNSGINAVSRAAVYVSHSIVTDNTTYGFAANDLSVIYTFQNNELRGNSTATFGTITPIALQ